LDEGRANRIVAVQFLESGDHAAAAVACAELSTGAFTLHRFDADRVVDELARLGPSEILYVETADGVVPRRVGRLVDLLGCATTARPAWTFRPSDALDTLRRHYGVQTLAGFGLDDDDRSLPAAGALVRYLQDTQSPHGDDRRLAHLRPPRRETAEQYVMIDATSLRSLELDRTLRTGQVAGSVLNTLQRCTTAMGKRLLRQWLCYPLREIDAIRARQDVVAAILADRTLADALAGTVGAIQDVARIAGRTAMRRATPRDLVALGASLDRLPALLDLLGDVPALRPWRARLDALVDALGPLGATIRRTCVEHPPSHLRDGGLIRDGIDEALDEARTLQTDAHGWLARYQKRLIDETAIPSLKVGYNRVFGYYIEITHVHVDKVPATFNRKQTLKNAERYITPDLKTFEEKVTTAQSRALDRERDLFDGLCDTAAAQAEALGRFADIVAELDVLAGFADVARRFNYRRPELVDAPVLDIRQGRHPVLDRLLGERFVPNDCVLGVPDESGRAGSLALITGPNMAGKSTYIRQVALIALLAHTGCFVPAEAATIGTVDRIFTRIGASDEIHSGQSTFMVEMTETANILHHATARSLIILDEIGRGTSTLDGLSLAWAIAETLAETGSRTLFATHYHELTTLAEQVSNVTNLHVTAREWQDEIVFIYRVLPGATNRSYGIHVARIAGVPTRTLRRATELLDSLVVHTEHGSPRPAGAAAPAPERGAQLGLFTEYVEHPVVPELRAVQIERLTPLDAFDLLRRLRDRVDAP
ncbi:MAG: DNA mismatch repair protein MutS, partial [Phycisphaerales bacterium]|nr:DNA mismatch repair protein MutS [Phycisphaerales bacterium]